MSYQYVYKCPTESGYAKFKITRKRHNEIMSNRKQNIFTKIDAYYKENKILFHYTTSLLGKTVITIMLPYSLVVHGLSSLSEMATEYKKLFSERKSGSYTNDFVNRKMYDGEVNGRFTELEKIYKQQIN